MFFNTNRKRIDGFFTKASQAASTALQMTLEDGRSFEMWLNAQGEADNWPMYATVAGVFLNVQEMEKTFEDKPFRKLIVSVGKRLREWDPAAEQAFYDLADFVVTSHARDVDSLSAAGLWLICKAKKGQAAPEDVSIGYRLGQFFYRAAVQ